MAAGIWLRGVWDGRLPPSHEEVWHSFAFGFLALAALLLMSKLDPAGFPPGADRWLLLFFASGMAALALASLDLSAITGRMDATMRVRLNRYWLASVLTVIVVLVGIGLLLGALITPDTVAYVLGWTSGLLNLIGTILGYILLAVVYVVFLVLTPLINWLHSLAGGQPRQQPMQMPDFQRQVHPIPTQTGVELSPALAELLRWLGAGAIVLILVVAFALALRYFRRGDDEETDETRESIVSRELLAGTVGVALAPLAAAFPASTQRPSRSVLGIGW